MLGCNCAFPECGTSRRQSYSGIGIFRIPQRETEDYIALGKQDTECCEEVQGS